MGSTLILTANFGGFDRAENFPQVEQSGDVDWLYITDGEAFVDGRWDALRVTPDPVIDPRWRAKTFKCTPLAVRLTPAAYDHAIWIDSNMEITSPTFVADAIASINESGMAVFEHPRRDCIYDEFAASIGAESQGGKYDEAQLRRQITRYRNEGHPEHWGLWAGGTIAWDLHSRNAWRIASSWLSECKVGSVQDQLSLPVVCRRLDLRPGTFPIPQLQRHAPWFGNDWVRIHPHEEASL